MKQYHLTIITKSKKFIKDFFTFFNNTSVNSNLIKKYFQRKKQKKILTILKSPHVNKTAQEQFESRIFSNKLTVYSPNIFQSLIFLKKIKINLFSKIKIKVKFAINKKSLRKSQSKIFNPNNFKLTIFDKHIKKKDVNYFKKTYVNEFKQNFMKQTTNFLKIFDIYGEFSKKTFR